MFAELVFCSFSELNWFAVWSDEHQEFQKHTEHNSKV